MSSGHSTRLFNESISVEEMETRRAGRSPVRSWRILDAERRLAIVEKALQPANDRVRGSPLAL